MTAPDDVQKLFDALSEEIKPFLKKMEAAAKAAAGVAENQAQVAEKLRAAIVKSEREMQEHWERIHKITGL